MTALATPARTRAQRMAGLAHANRVRVYRAELKRNLKSGAPVAPIIADPAPEVLTMRVYDLLLALPLRGPVTVRALMRANLISPAKTVGGLSERQRSVLVGALDA